MPERDSKPGESSLEEEILTSADLQKIYSEKGKAGLIEFLGSLPQKELDRLEAELEKENEKLVEDRDKLLKQISEAQKRVVELLPDYPVSKEIAVIVNGDVKEDRHLDNVKRAIEVLKGRGFDEFYVMGGREEDTRGENVHIYDVSMDGIDRLFTDVGNVLEKDALVFYYGTGHGGSDGKEREFVKIGGKNLYKGDFIKRLQIIKEKQARGIFTFDNCYSGSFPEAIVSSGIEGIALSPGVEGRDTHCQLFAPYLFDAIEKFEGENVVQRAFLDALQIYRVKSGNEAFGEYRSTILELSVAGFEKIANGSRSVLVELTSDYCHACKELSKELNRFVGVAGDKVNVLTLNMDRNEELRELSKKLGINEGTESLPTVFMIHPGGRVERLFVGYMPFSQIFSLVGEKITVDFDYDSMFKKYLDEGVVTKKYLKWLLKRFPAYGAAVFIDARIPMEVVNTYDRGRFSANDILYLYSYGKHILGVPVRNRDAEKYDTRFSGEDIVWLVKCGISNEYAMKYDKRFSGLDIWTLASSETYYYLADRFDERLRATEIAALVDKCRRKNIDLEEMIEKSREVFGYDARFTRGEAFKLFECDVSNDYAMKYDERFSGDDIYHFNEWAPFEIGRKIGWEEANRWDERLSGLQVGRLIVNKIDEKGVEDRLNKGENPKDVVNDMLKKAVTR